MILETIVNQPSDRDNKKMISWCQKLIQATKKNNQNNSLYFLYLKAYWSKEAIRITQYEIAKDKKWDKWQLRESRRLETITGLFKLV